MTVFLGFLWLIISLFILIKAADFFTEYSEKLGLAFGISPFVIGITIIALGTSLPELASSAFSVYKGSTEIVAANVIGSNIANVLLVIGLAAVFAKKILEPSKKILDDNGVLLIGSTFLISFVCFNGEITFIEAIFLFLGYVTYIVYSLLEHKKDKTKKKKSKISFKIPAMILLSAVFIYLGAENTIDSLLYLAELLGISTAVISLTVVALGTSLPEAVVSVSAARKGKYDIALGNIIGSNMFNVLLIPGILALFSKLVVSIETIQIGISFLILSTIIFLFSLFNNKISKGEGFMFLLIYLLFIYALYI